MLTLSENIPVYLIQENLIKRGREISPLSLSVYTKKKPIQGHSKKVVVHKPEEGPQQEQNRTVINFCYSSHSVCGIL